MSPFAIGTDAAAGNDEVDMGMMQEVLSPGVEYTEEADLRSEMSGIARDGEQGFRGSVEQEAVKQLFVVKGDAGELAGKSEDDMKVFDRQQFFLPAAKPLGTLRVQALGAVAVAAGVVRNTRIVALVAFFNMASERGGAARLNRPHGAQLLTR